MTQAYCTTNLQYKHAPSYSCIHTHVQAHTHPDPIFITNAEHLDCNFLVEHAPPCCALTHIFYSGKYTPCSWLWIRPSTVPRLMFIQTRGPLAACLLNDYILKNCLLKIWGPPGARGLGARAPMDPFLIRHWEKVICFAMVFESGIGNTFLRRE